MLFVFPLIAAIASSAPPPDDTLLEWKGGRLSAGAGSFERQWTLADGLPAAQSLRFAGREWVRPEGSPTTSLTDGAELVPPLKIDWSVSFGRETPVEAPSRHGALTVFGSDGVGYRWELKVFPGLPSVICRIKELGVRAIPAGRAGPAERDLVERISLVSPEADLIVVDLADGTDRADNLASERSWRLSPKETIRVRTNLGAVEDPFRSDGLIFLKHAPLPMARPIPVEVDLVGQDRLIRLFGHGGGAEGEGYAWSVSGYTGGKWGRTQALHALQSRLREFRPERDGQIVSNTWGDRSQDSRISQSFLLAEIAADRKMGVDACQIDDGWQEGLTGNTVLKSGGIWETGYWAKNPNFWTPRRTVLPAGLEPVAAVAKSAGIGLGLWFSPDSESEYRNWERDAAAVVGFNHQWGVTKVKIDGIKIETKRGEINFHRFVSRVLQETEGRVAFDLDVTNGIRPGYFGLMEANLFLENRYTDWHNWWPHATLRNLWQLAWYVPPQRLRIEFLNSDRNQEKYSGDPLAPSRYPPDYALATTLVANPLAWCEVSRLPSHLSDPMTKLIGLWKTHRDELHAGTIYPVGECPSGASWTGFCSVGKTFTQVLVFRELNQKIKSQIELPIRNTGWRIETIAGEGAAGWSGDRFEVSIPHAMNYLWIRLAPLN